MDIFIERALKELGLEWSNPDGFELKNKKDLDVYIKHTESQKAKLERIQYDLQETMEIVQLNLELINQLKHQVLVEEYKELNKGKDLDIF